MFTRAVQESRSHNIISAFNSGDFFPNCALNRPPGESARVLFRNICPQSRKFNKHLKIRLYRGIISIE